MGPDEFADYVDERGDAVIATVAPDGAPRTAYVSIAATPTGELVFDVRPGSRSLANLRFDKRLAVSIGGPDGVTLQAQGVADEPTGADLAWCSRIYVSRFPEFRESVESRAVVVVRIRAISGGVGDYRTTPPTLRALRLTV